MKRYIAFFDLDKTIIEDNSARLIAIFAYKNKFLSKKDIIYGLYLTAAYRIGIVSTEHLMEQMTKWLKNVNESKLQNLYEELRRHIITYKIRDKAKKMLEFHRDQGGRTVILSASIRDICEPIQNYLGMDDIICTEMESINQIYTGKVIGSFCFEDEKLRRVKEYCKVHHFDLKDAWYYADSISDLMVLKEVGHPVCVSPDRKLKKSAKKYEWPIEIW